MCLKAGAVPGPTLWQILRDTNQKESTLYDQEASSFLGALGRNSKSRRLRRAGREHVEVDEQIFSGVEALRKERRLIGSVRINLKLNSQRTVLQKQKKFKSQTLLSLSSSFLACMETGLQLQRNQPFCTL